MNPVSILRRMRTVIFAFVVVCLAVTVFSVWRISARQRDEKARAKQAFNARVREGAGEISFAQTNADAESVRESVNSLAKFIRTRAGVNLSERVKAKLAEMESDTLSGKARRITPDELSQAMTDVLMERIAALRDDEIEHATETLRGFDAPDLPASFKKGRNTVKFRAHIAGTTSPDEFIAQMKAVRDADETTRPLYKGMARKLIGDEVAKSVAYLAEAAPEQFGSASSGLTPTQAFLISYSIASDDLLTDSSANLQKRMKAKQKFASEYVKQPYSSPEGHTAYGVNGYEFSAPLDVIFDDATTVSLLNRIAERSVTQ